MVGDARIAGITAFWPASAMLHRGLAQRVSLVKVGLRGEMARRALQVIRHRPVTFVSECFLDRCAISGPTPPSCA